MSKECSHEDDYGVTSLDGMNCFLCSKSLKQEQSIILQALELKKKAEDFTQLDIDNICDILVNYKHADLYHTQLAEKLRAILGKKK